MIASVRKLCSPYGAAAAAILILTALILLVMGRVPYCECGYIKIWQGVVFSSENSQHLTDWYTFSHIIHGFAFFALLWLLARKTSLGTRFLLAMCIEAAWEIFENTPFIINRYRESAIALDYYGDSVINSVADILAMMLGFWLARRLPVWVSIAVVIFLELFVAYFIRDNLMLNVIMLIHPFRTIQAWQVGG